MKNYVFDCAYMCLCTSTHRYLYLSGNSGLMCTYMTAAQRATFNYYEGPESTCATAALFGGCTFLLDDSLQLSSAGSCAATSGYLFLENKNIASLAPGVFFNMPSLQ